MWEEQGREVGNRRLADMGLTNTDLLGITTTVRDANTLLKRLINGDDLDDDNTFLMRSYLRDYPDREFRQGMPSAFNGVENVTIYSKPGLYDEGWLDAAIITLPDNREIVLSIFSDGASYPEVRTIAEAITAPLLNGSN